MTALLEKEKWKAYHQTSWARFNKNNSQHKLILSLCHQAGWTISHPKYGRIPDLKRLQAFLKSNKAPVQKPLLKQSHQELSKTIAAMEGIVKHRYK